MTDLSAEAKEKLDAIYFDEQELLLLSIDSMGMEEDSEGHKYAADFRIGFRYGFLRGKEAGYEFSKQESLAEVEKLTEDLRMCREIGVEMQREVNRKLSVENKKLEARIEALENALKDALENSYEYEDGCLHCGVDLKRKYHPDGKETDWHRENCWRNKAEQALADEKAKDLK